MADLSVSLVLEGPSGPIELEDPDNGYSLHSDTFGQAAVTHRKQSIESDWMGGTYYGRSVPGNITEPVVVWVEGATQFEFASRLQAVIDGFEQLTYVMRKRVGDAQWTWQCFMADHTLETSQPMMLATMGLLRVQVEHLPAVPMEQVVVP